MKRLVSYFCMVCILGLVLLALDPLDRLLSSWLRQHTVAGFAQFMDRSVFEGKGLGAGDFTVFLQLTVLALWLVSFLPWAPQGLQRWRAPFSYILATSIMTALWVHLSKGLIARPRPYELIDPSSSWQGMLQRLGHGWGHGSFPSGHTANAISLLAVCYALHGMRYRRLARALAIIVLIFVGSMAISRVMMGAHWPTDTLAAASLGWVIAHHLFRSWQQKTEQAL